MIAEAKEMPPQTSGTIAQGDEVIVPTAAPAEQVGMAPALSDVMLKQGDADAESDWDAESDEEGRRDHDNASKFRIVQPSRYAAARIGDALVLLGTPAEGELNVALTCSHCGQPALRFPGSRWSSTVDYFHFRNYSPDHRMPERMQEDLSKLCQKLEADETAAAFACGCSWQSITGEKDIGSGKLGSTPAAPHGGVRLPSDDAQVLGWKAAG